MSQLVVYSEVDSAHDHTRNKNIAVVSDKVLNDLGRAVLDVDIAPIDPTVLRLHGSAEKVISCLAHCLSTRTLSSETVSVLDILTQMNSEIFLNDGSAVEGNRVWAILNALEFLGKDGKCVISAVANEKSEIDQVVRVCQLRDEIEVVVDVGSGVAQRSEEEYALLVIDGLSRALYGIEVDTADGGVVDLDGSVVIEDDGGL